MVLATCDIEGLGLTVLEAMAAGPPVVAVAAAGHLETIGGVCRKLRSTNRVIVAGAGPPAGRSGASEPEPGRLRGASCERGNGAQFTIEAQAAATEAVYRSVL